ncbi:MAG TPA: biotin--[acetyl-CoA-carboxylase] ligase [Actinomycetota bacterium]|nr:biotin--[acetyl-CoA-carboxylase] ligase [Actinomycetota bacterium]
MREAGIASPPVWLDVTGSTNVEALRLAEDGAPEWTVVATGHQTAGRGRLGRSWADAPGKALLCSIVLRPPLSAEEAPLVTLLAAAAIVRAADVPGLRSKWPNDVVADGRKVGGILAEASVAEGRVRHVALGFGINVTVEEGEFPEEIRGTAASLASVGGRSEIEPLLTRILRNLTDAYPVVRERSVDDYRRVCDTLGRTVRGRSIEGETIEGTAVDVDRLGGLVIRTDAGLRTIAFGQIEHLG